MAAHFGPRETTWDWTVITCQWNHVTWKPWEAAGVAEPEVGAQNVFASLVFLPVVTLAAKAALGSAPLVLKLRPGSSEL